MEWADVCWFEWCDDLIAHASRLPVASYRRVVCRLHSYEMFTSYIHQVNWKTVDRLVFVGEPIREYVLGQLPALPKEKTAVIPNGVMMERYPLVQRAKGFNIAYVGYINYKKGPMLLLHAFKAVYDRDPRYRLFIAGKYQDMRYKLYFDQMIEEMGLTGSVRFDGWQTNLNAYLRDKHYIISTSPLESQHMSIMEAMAAGVKPLVHHFYGAKKVYADAWIWNTIGELVDKVTEDEYDSEQYRSFVESRYSFAGNVRKIGELISGLLRPAYPQVDAAAPKITIGIINYNYGRFLGECLQSVIGQNYPNKEILVVDDHSTDDSVSILEQYRTLDPSIRVIRRERNVGLSDAAIRDIFREASGQYVLLLSADDYLPHDGVLEDYMACFRQRDDLDYAYGHFLIVDEQGNRTGQWTYRAYAPDEAVRSIYRRMGSGVIPMVGLFKRSYYRDGQAEWVSDPDNPNAGDTLNCLINLKRGWNVQLVDKPVLCYRRHRGSITFDIRKRIASLIVVMEYLVHHFPSATYLPGAPRERIERNGQEAFKNFEIGRTYGAMVRSYYSNGFTRHLGHREKADCLRPLAERMRHYFRLCRASEDAGDYHPAIEEINADIERLIG
jgi:Glycosyltransferases involved in cell wall biogenesis